jgi:hypothetical protein
MVSRRLIEYVKDDLKKYSEKEVRNILIKEGYPQELADSAIKAALENDNQQKGIIRKDEKENSDIKSLEEEKEIRKEKLKKGKEQIKESIDGLKKKSIKNLKNNLKLLFLYLVVIIIVGGCFIFNGLNFFNINNIKEDTNPKDIKEYNKELYACSNIDDYYQRLYCCINITDRSSSMCDFIEDEDKKDSCCLEVAEKTGDINACFDIGNEDKRLCCEGIAELDSSICDRIKEDTIKDYCYEKVGEKEQNIIVPSSWPWGVYFPTSQKITEICNLITNERECKMFLSRGSLDNIIKIDEGKADMTVVDGQIAYNAYEGKEMFENDKMDSIRSIILLFPENIHIIVKKSSNVSSLDGLVGKKVIIGAEDKMASINARLILEKKGILNEVLIISSDAYNRDKLGLPPGGHIDTRDRIGLLQTNVVDALIISIPHTMKLNEVFQVKEEDISNLMVIPVENDLIDILVSENEFYTKGTIKKDTYSNMESDINTLAVNSILITNEYQDEEFIYNLTKNLFENQSFFDSYIMPHIEQAKGGLCIPLHKGAERYYIERGFIN